MSEPFKPTIQYIDNLQRRLLRMCPIKISETKAIDCVDPMVGSLCLLTEGKEDEDYFVYASPAWEAEEGGDFNVITMEIDTGLNSDILKRFAFEIDFQMTGDLDKDVAKYIETMTKWNETAPIKINHIG